MPKCTCPKCQCHDTWKCLHHPDGSYCKCCIDDSSLATDGIIDHMPQFDDRKEGDEL